MRGVCRRDAGHTEVYKHFRYYQNPWLPLGYWDWGGGRAQGADFLCCFYLPFLFPFPIRFS